MLKDAVLAKLNEQIKHEAYSAYLYYSMVGYFETRNLGGFANWMLIQAQEEITHMHRIFSYINDRGATVELEGVEKPQHTWDTPVDAIRDALEHERFISEKIGECVSLAVAENDHSTNSMLQWFVAEQVEEEATADDLLQKLIMIGDNASGLFLLDSELSKRRFGGDSGGNAV